MSGTDGVDSKISGPDDATRYQVCSIILKEDFDERQFYPRNPKKFLWGQELNCDDRVVSVRVPHG